MYWLRFLLLGVLCWLPVLAGSTEVRDLYEVEVPVADQSRATRQQGIADALARVVTKVSGRSDVAVPVEGAAALVQRFRYVSLPPSEEAAEPGAHKTQQEAPH